MHVVVDSRNDGDFQMISSKDLWGLVNEDMSVFPVLSDVVLDFIEVDIRGPTVDIDNG